MTIYWLAFMALNTFQLQNDYRMLYRLRKVNWTKPVTKVSDGCEAPGLGWNGMGPVG